MRRTSSLRCSGLLMTSTAATRGSRWARIGQGYKLTDPHLTAYAEAISKDRRIQVRTDEGDERVKVDLPPDAFVAAVLAAGPHPNGANGPDTRRQGRDQG